MSTARDLSKREQEDVATQNRDDSASAPSQSSLQDQELVQYALEGDQEAFSSLLSKYRQPIRHHISRMVRDKQVVDDLLQEIFIKAFSSLASYSTKYAFSTWLYKIATNHTIDHLRRKKLSTLSIDRPMKTKDGELEYELPDSTYRPDRHILEDQRRSLIQEAIDSLPPKYNRVIVLRHQQELSYDEIAKELDLPLGTVKAHIFRARELLYKRLRHKRESL
jgi:RNA polymerase sigma-70 factor (ECF subfamily)